jgi:ABC-type antimicrobial peptide transport system permease subunit
MQCYTLLRPGVTVAQAENAMAPYVKKYRPTSKNVHHYKLQPLADVHFSPNYGGPMEKRNLWILSIIGLFLIVTACVNFINLATAQALKRSKEVGVRKVLGGIKGQLFWQFISETAIISAIGIVIAIVLSFLILPFANDFFKSQMVLNLFSDSQLVLFIIALGVVVTFFAGSYPGLILAGFQPVIALKGKLSHQNIGGFNTRRTLIVAQFAISQILIIGMVVIMNQMRYAKQSDPGFDKEAIAMVEVGHDSTRLKAKTLKNEISALPGVEKVSLCYAAPASDEAWNNSIRFDNQPEEVNFRTSIKAADEVYLSTFGLDLVAGRNMFPSDTVREFLVNEAFTRKLNFKSPQEAIGKIIVANGGSMVAPIVGIVKDFHDKSFHEDINAVAITTYSEDYSYYAVKLNLATARRTLAAIEKAWLQKHPDQLFEYRFLDEKIASFYETEDRMLTLVQLFSFIAIFIGCLGLYGLVSFMAAQKTKEIGIRKVLGSSLPQILWIFGKEFVRLILVAFVIAAPIAWWMMNQWLQDFKFHIEIGVWVFLSAILITLVIATLTVVYQAMKAALMNPIKSLKSE